MIPFFHDIVNSCGISIAYWCIWKQTKKGNGDKSGCVLITDVEDH